MPRNRFVFSESPIVVSALASCITTACDYLPVRSFTRSDELISELAANKAGVILIDFDSRQFDLLVEIHRISPASAIILWVRELSTELAYEALHMGVRGIVPQRASAPTLTQAVSKVLSGELWLDQSINVQLLTTTPVRLTKRESSLLTLVSHGLKNKEIAAALDLSENTVRMYLSQLYVKVGAKDRYELAIYVLKNFGSGHKQSGTTTGTIPAGSPQVIFRSTHV